MIVVVTSKLDYIGPLEWHYFFLNPKYGQLLKLLTAKSFLKLLTAKSFSKWSTDINMYIYVTEY